MNAKRVLIVEQDSSDAAAWAAALRDDGCQAHRVRSRAEAVDAAARELPDLVVAGAATGRGDGARLVRELKALAQPGFLPVVLVSRAADADVRVRALRAGADDCLARPCHVPELAARAGALLRLKATQDALRREKAELERLSVTDPLTGAFNRRYFQLRLEQEVERSRRHGNPLAILMLDLDHFKAVNDRYGHPAGDAVLRSTARLVDAELRRVDVCTRWGGEEFAVILPDTGREGAAIVAHRLLRALRERVCSGAREGGRAPEAFRVTASIGIAVHLSGEAASAEQLVAAADAALYRAKRLGRDRACVAGEEAAGTAEAVRPGRGVALQRWLARPTATAALSLTP